MKMGYLIILFGIVCIALGCYMLKQSATSTAASSNPPIEKMTNTAQEQDAKTSVNSYSEQPNTPTGAKQKGTDFEKFVIQKFSNKYFSIKEWRSDKYVDGHYAESNTYPDMELELCSGNDRYSLAVECKYRSKLSEKGWLTWCDEAQLKRYHDYERKFNIPVIVVIGLGGTPSNPDNIYCIPLKALKYNSCNEKYLNKFKHDKDRNFFYDTKRGTLE